MTWTEARVKSFITSVLRKGFSRWPEKYAALKKALVGKKLNKATGRMAYHYKCAKCRKTFPGIDVQVDHIDPVVHTTDGFQDWNTYIERLFCEELKLQVLCSGCHAIKTKKEGELRRECRSVQNAKKKK